MLQIVTNCYNVRAIWSEVRNAATAEVGYAMIRLDRPVASRGPSVPPWLLPAPSQAMTNTTPTTHGFSLLFDL